MHHRMSSLVCIGTGPPAFWRAGGRGPRTGNGCPSPNVTRAGQACAGSGQARRRAIYSGVDASGSTTSLAQACQDVLDLTDITVRRHEVCAHLRGAVRCTQWPQPHIVQVFLLYLSGSVTRGHAALSPAPTVATRRTPLSFSPAVCSTAIHRPRRLPGPESLRGPEDL
jgi:hypothetical protein